ncbi:hypothetical protein M409DRAFT_57101 [Zasmidium cellare ATCC 36951]|uniref:Zn(2)-C6 fungal-type domain-containing protein n=1 Tax=Zasmidium cellare ATCC 36951 TaxID=1080233 RepID=A0A6A6CAC4_ZASCE|nr:uncharacterized protein M409DRAFT_57101 [Zasmidium cellare ATCC 36951]KAF2164001.1 hypothetical protein M409DRAFT_57101 [Zasmidium cellare ATCC 36951]
MAPGHTGKRARVVCVRCHEKKIRCDLQLARDGSLPRHCSHCVSADAECTFRPSNKGRRSRKREGIAVRAVELYQKNGDEGNALRESSVPRDGNHATAVDRSKHHVATTQRTSMSRLDDIDDIPPMLQQSNLETYWEFIYPWCPVIDPGPEAASEPILKHAIAMLAGSVNTPLIPHAKPRDHYRRARNLFHAEGTDALTRVQVALLLSCSSAGPPNVGSTGSPFWWIGVAIRLAQDIGLHREPPSGVSKEVAGLRRRIWWTLYARERIIAICQGQPCIIDEDYTDIEPPLEDDFPPACASYAFAFTRWVHLCDTIGFVNKQMFLSHRTGRSLPTHDIANRLTHWLRSISPALQLPISENRTTSFDRHVHFLYLPYLATISLVYLNTSQRIPEACAAAVIAAACTTRIFEDFLARGCVRFLLGLGDWYIAIAALSLRPLRSLDFLSTHAMAQIRLLSIALKQLVPTSCSAKLIDAGLDRLMSKERFEHALRTPLQGHDHAANPARGQPSTLDDLCAGDGVPWPEFFPFVSVETSPLLKAILTECQHTFPELWPEVDLNQFSDFLEEFNDGSGDWSSSGVLT